MTKPIYSEEEAAALFAYVSASSRDRAGLMKNPQYKALAKKSEAHADGVSRFADVVSAALFERMPSEQKDAVVAMQFVKQGMSEILGLPDVQRSEVVSGVIQRICDSIAALTIFDAREEMIAAAFAAPARRITNSKNASKFRTGSKSLDEAHKLFLGWAADPSHYPTKTAFKRDMVGKGFCDDLTTPDRWLARWAEDLPQDSLLWAKLGKLKKS